MNLLNLYNKVLDRLREERINSAIIGTNPYYNSIGGHIEDAQRQVENAWQWSQLRQIDEIVVAQGQTNVVLPDSADNNYVIQRILIKENGAWLRWISDDQLALWNSNVNQVPIQENYPGYYATGLQDPTTGNQTIDIYQPPDMSYTLRVTSWHNQDPLVSADDILKVPSLPVYTLATALASRERGEVGGAPTSALFEQAQAHLSDAIAYDSARYPEELDWHGGQIVPNTNVRNA